MKHYFWVLVFILSGCGINGIKHAPEALLIFDKSDLKVPAIEGCWESGYLAIQSVCYEGVVDYKNYIDSPTLITQAEVVALKLPLPGYISAAKYSVLKQENSGDFQEVLSGEVNNGTVVIDSAKLSAGIYVIDVFTKWRGRRDAYYVFGLKLQP